MSVAEETRKTYKDRHFKVVNGFIYENTHSNRIRSCVPNFVQTNTASGPQYTDSYDIIMHLLSLRRRYSAQSATMEMRRRQKFNSVTSMESPLSESKTERMQSPKRSAPLISESKTESPRRSAPPISEFKTESPRRTAPPISEFKTERLQSPRR